MRFLLKRQFIWISSGLVQPCLNGIYLSPLHYNYPQLMIKIAKYKTVQISLAVC